MPVVRAARSVGHAAWGYSGDERASVCAQVSVRVLVGCVNLGKLGGLGCARFGQRASKSGKKSGEVGWFWVEVTTFWDVFGRFLGVFEG